MIAFPRVRTIYIYIIIIIYIILCPLARVSVVYVVIKKVASIWKASFPRGLGQLMGVAH